MKVKLHCPLASMDAIENVDVILLTMPCHSVCIFLFVEASRWFLLSLEQTCWRRRPWGGRVGTEPRGFSLAGLGEARGPLGPWMMSLPL